MAAELLLVAERRRTVTQEPGETQQPGESQQQGESQHPATQRGQSPRQHGVELRQFVRADGEMRQRSRPVPVDERPAARSVRIAPL
jgi:hypothetical protein